jgi:hypothetical protein
MDVHEHPIELAPGFAGLHCVRLIEFNPPIQTWNDSVITLSMTETIYFDASKDRDYYRNRQKTEGTRDFTIRHYFNDNRLIKYAAVYEVSDLGGYALMFFQTIRLEPKP